MLQKNYKYAIIQLGTNIKNHMLVNYQNINVYQGESPILQNVNFHVDESDFVYIIGKVGSGKSSLLKTIYCELDINAAEDYVAEVLGRDLKSIKRRDIPALRREMGIIFQDFQLLGIHGNGLPG